MDFTIIDSSGGHGLLVMNFNLHDHMFRNDFSGCVYVWVAGEVGSAIAIRYSLN